MTEIEAIKERHSVRAYLDREIEQEKAKALEELIEACNREGNLHLQFLEKAGGTFGRLLSRAMGLGSAPSVIACVGADDDTLEERVGYFGEKVVLFAQQLGLNTCWAGTFNAKKVPAQIGPGERLVIVIAVGYGASQGQPHKSRTLEQVASGRDHFPDWFVKGVELALLAPTALNQQKFEFVLNQDDTVSLRDKKGPFSRVDLGIVRYHFDAGRRAALGQE